MNILLIFEFLLTILLIYNSIEQIDPQNKNFHKIIQPFPTGEGL